MSSSQSQVRTDEKRHHLESTRRVKLTVCRLQNSNVFYFGGPLLGINNPTLRCNSEILTNSDGTRVAFAVDPGLSASRSLGASVENGGEGLLTAADLDHDFRDARNPFDDAETGIENTEDGLDGEVEGSVVSFSFFHPPPQQLLNTTFGTHTTTTQSCPPTSTTQKLLNIAFHTYTQAFQRNHFNMANHEDNWKLHLLADTAIAISVLEGLLQANATAQQQADATAPQPSSSESSSSDDESPAQAPPSQGPTAVNSTATPGKLTSNQPSPTISHSISVHGTKPASDNRIANIRTHHRFQQRDRGGYADQRLRSCYPSKGGKPNARSGTAGQLPLSSLRWPFHSAEERQGPLHQVRREVREPVRIEVVRPRDTGEFQRVVSQPHAGG